MNNSENSQLNKDSDESRWEPIEIGRSMTENMGRSHTLESAVSDLIDNSITAKADHVHIRFMESKPGQISKIRIRDNGTGMSSQGLAEAMRFHADDRKQAPTGLSMFGIGLKAASFSQARELKVYTCDQNGNFSGTGLLRSDAGGQNYYEVLTSKRAEQGFRGYDNDNSTGTVVEWRELEGVAKFERQADNEEWLTGALKDLRNHIGLVFHRYIANGLIRITFDRFREETQQRGGITQASAINPFNFERSGHPDFPLTLSGKIPSRGSLEMKCFIIPPGSKSESARLMDQDRQKWQGVYIYWRDRLIHFGDWNRLVPAAKKEYSLARVEINLQDHHLGIVRLNPEKAQVQLLPEFREAAQQLQDVTGTYNLETFVAASEETLKRSNKRKASLKPMTRIKHGLPKRVTETIEKTVGWRPAQNRISLDWAFLDPQQLFDFDAGAKLIRLNSRHRIFLSATKANRHEDAPIVRTLLYLLLESYFSGKTIRQSTADQVSALQEILGAAVVEQLDEMDDHERQVSEARSSESAAVAKSHHPLVIDEVLVPDRGAVTEYESSPPVKKQTIKQPKVAAIPDREESPFRKTTPPTFGEAELAQVPTGQSVIDILRGYRKGTPIPTLATELEVQERGVVVTLAAALFGDGSTESNRDFAPRHGIAWAPEERSKANMMFREGTAVPKIAEKLGRTPLSVSWQLLDGPKPLPVPTKVIKRFQRLHELKKSSYSA